MNRSNFLSRLRDGLHGVGEREIDDIIADYSAHFSEGLAAGRSESDVAAALGDPSRLARELHAEMGLRRWEERRSASSLVAALLAFIGLATMDLIFLLPLLFVVALMLFIFGAILVSALLTGIALVMSGLSWDPFSIAGGAIARRLVGVGLVAGGIGGGALLLIAIDFMVRVLGRYTRLHYQLLVPSKSAA